MHMKNDRLKTAIFALSAALIWGLAFAFQRSAAGSIQAFTFNMYRCMLAVLSLGLFLFVQRKKLPVLRAPGDAGRLALGGLVTGVLLFFASNLQQMGLAETEAGKTGFLTTLYTVLVPVLGVIFFRKKVPFSLWISVAIAALGLYLICVKAGFSLVRSDMLVIGSAILYAFYILAVDHFVAGLNPVAMSCAHFFVSGVLSFICAMLFEHPSLAALRECLVAVLYVGVCSSAMGYTLEFYAHQSGNPVTVALLLSTESVFSLLGGALLLREFLSARELLGCAVMFCAVILSQLPEKKKNA